MQEGEGQTSADVVVGAGIAGLTVARDLAEAGRTVTVIEASERTGGLVRPLPVRRRGEDRAVAVLDAGAEAMGVRRPEAIDLVAELGLQIEHPAARSWVQPVHHGGSTTARPIPSRSLLGIPSDLSDPLVADILGTRAAAAAAALDASVGPGIPAGASLADVVRTRLGNDVLELLVRPIAGALHAADPADLMVDSVAPGLASAVAAEGSLTAAVARLVPAGPVVATIVGGMHRLPVALEDAARAAGARILVDSRVESLSPDAGGWLVRTAGGEEVRTGQVVLAATGRAAVRLLSPHVAEAADLTLRSGAPVEHRTLVLDAPELDAAPRGSGIIVAEGARVGGHPVRAKALTHASAKWPWARRELGGLHAVRLSYGRPGEEINPAGTQEALANASALLGVELTERDVVASVPFSHAGALAPQTPEHRAEVAELARITGERGVHLAGAWVAGTGLPAVIGHARGVAREITAA
jgi:oxygen-dependent protoporphyrinogen oxidase